MTFRNATIHDLKEMQQLYVDTVQSICRQDYNQEQINVLISSVENTARWLDIIHNQWVLLAEINHKIVGYATLKSSHYIDLFYVHKNSQRQGIAGQLLVQLEREALNRQIERLSAEISITAKAFFERNGFQVIAEQKNRIKNVELMNFRMGKSLKGSRTQGTSYSENFHKPISPWKRKIKSSLPYPGLFFENLYFPQRNENHFA